MSALNRGRRAGIYIGDRLGEPLRAVDQIEAVAGRGLEGDRYFHGKGKFSKGDPSNEVTLVEKEALDYLAREHGIRLAPLELRRNLLVEGLSLNALVGARFRVGQ